MIHAIDSTRTQIDRTTKTLCVWLLVAELEFSPYIVKKKPPRTTQSEYKLSVFLLFFFIFLLAQFVPLLPSATPLRALHSP